MSFRAASQTSSSVVGNPTGHHDRRSLHLCSLLVKALTVRQPWASLIIAGYKDVENRSWTTSYRGRLAVHAGRTLDKEGLDEYADLVESLGELPRGR